jgi:endoglycosylceramidase
VTGMRTLLLLAATLAALATGLTGLPAAAAAQPVTGHAGRWITDADGRVLLTHGVNMVYKVGSYAPDEIGFDDDDAAFLAANGFDSVRLGVIWKALEPRPGVYDDGYLDRLAATTETLARHGILTLVDMHQDQYNERFEGEGAPDWAVQDDGLPAEPKLGFGPDYLFMPALNRAFDHFWANDPASDGVGVQEHYARAWAHVAARFAHEPGVLGYDLFNEPWPGSVYPLCVNPAGCPVQDRQLLAAMHTRVRDAIRAHDPAHLLWYEPFVLFNNGADTSLPSLDPRAGMSFHDYCLWSPTIGSDTGCAPFDDRVFGNADAHAAGTGDALLLSEFGATDRADELSHMVARADEHLVSWMYWAYTGFDPTTSGGDSQSLVIDPRKPPTGDNVKLDKLKLLAIPHARAVAGTPLATGFDAGTFTLTYSTSRADGTGVFKPGALTTVAVPRVQYPHGYLVRATGATVTSPPDAPVLTLAALPGAATVTVTVTPKL